MASLRVVPSPPPEATLADWLSRTWRAYPRAEIEAHYSRRQLGEALAGGTVCRVAPGIYAGAVHAESVITRIDAATQWAGAEAWIGGAASLFVAGALRIPPMRVEVAVPAARRMSGRPRWVRVRRLSYRPPTVRIGEWQIVEPAVAWCLAFSELSADDRASALCRLVAADRSVLETATRAALELPALRSRRRMLSVLSRVAAGGESYLEIHAMESVFVGRRFDPILRQHVVNANGNRYRLDMYDASTMTAIELDGAGFHAGAWQWQRDIRRDADLAVMGILTVRFSYRDLTERPDWCRSMALDVLDRRSTRVRTVRQASDSQGPTQIRPLDALEAPWVVQIEPLLPNPAARQPSP
ncbi:MAG: hypothetical protein HGA51_09930, partial [Demequinaceae bacterium]|nr:hypothetical protein [Demequinaceae bacterium]